MPTFDPLAPIYVPPIVPQSAIDRAPQPVNPAQDPGVPTTTPTVVPVSARKITPPPVVPGVATGTSVTSINSEPLLDITTAAADVTPTSTTGNIVIPTTTKPGGLSYAVQYNANGVFGGTGQFEWDTVNNLVKIGNSYGGLKPTDLFVQGNIMVGEVQSRTGARPFGGGYAEIGRIRYIDDAGYPDAFYPSVYGFTANIRDFPNGTWESWLTMVNEPGHEYNAATALVLPQGQANGNATFFGISVNSTNARGSSLNNPYYSPIYSDPSATGWQQLLRLTGKDLFLPQLSEAVGPKFLAYNTANGRITYTDGVGNSSVTVQEEGSNVVSSSTINFVGSGVTASNVGGVATITVPGGITGVAVQEEGTNVVASANRINFVGSGVTASNVSGVATITITSGGNAAAAGNITEVQYNNGNSTFGANRNFVYNNGGLFVGGIGNTTANATGIITANSEFRVGLWSYDGTLNGDKYGRIRIGSDYRVKADPYYGFVADPNINPLVGIPARTLVTTNEELETRQATVLMDAQTYPANVASQGTVFGVSGIDLSYANSFQPTTGTEPGWYKFIDVTNTGNVKIGGSLVISPSFQRTPPANANVGIYFADGTFQYTAATGGGSGITVQEEGSNVVAVATTVNFLGAGVTASNVGGVAVVTVPGGVNTMYSGSPVTTPAQTINFTGPLANVTNVGFGTDTTDVTIGLTVQDESTVVTGNAAFGTLNFLGAGVTVTAGPTGVANITIPSGGGTPGSPNASIQFNDNGSFAGNTYFTFNKTNGNVDMALGNLTVSNGNITGYTNGIPLGYKYLPGNSVTGNRDISSSDIGGYIVKWGNSDITLTTPGFPGDSNLPVGTKIEIFNANPTGNANIVAGSGGGTSTVLVGPRPNAEGILSYVQVGPYEQVTLVKLGASASNVYTGNSVVWFCYGSAYPLGVAYP